MTVFVTGSTGFLGKNLVARLLRENEDVVTFGRKGVIIPPYETTHYCCDLSAPINGASDNLFSKACSEHKPNVIFYDADHDHSNQLANLNSVLDLLAEDFILVLDDANFQGVVSSADEFVETNNLRPLFRRKILTSVVEDDKDWWNGLYILVLSKS